MKNKNIAIIGGGFTGLVAAWRLAKKGHLVTVYEKGSELGGLASGFLIGGTNLEKAYHHIFKTDKDIIGLAEELGLESSLKWHESSIGLYYRGKIYPFVTPVDLLRFKPLNLVDKFRLGLVGIYLQKEKHWQKFIKINAWEWMKKYCGSGVYEVVWKPLLKGKFHNYYEKVSMAWLWARIHTRGNSKAKGEVIEKLGYFDGGFWVLVDKLEKEIVKMGGKIKTNMGVDKISNDKDKVTIKTGGKKTTYDKVIASVPSGVFAKMVDLDKSYTDKLNSIDYLGAIVVVFTTDQSLSKYYWHNINDADSPFLAFIQHTNLIDTSNYGGRHVYYMGTYLPHNHKYFGLNQEEIKQIFFKYLSKMFPEFEPKSVVEFHLFKLGNAQHVVTTDYPDKIPDYKTPLKNVYLANFSQIFPEDRGTNFAVREGNKISKLVDES